MLCFKKEKRYEEIIDNLTIRNIKMDCASTTNLKNWTEKNGIRVFCFSWNMGASVS